jgi:hypothetical protein
MGRIDYKNERKAIKAKGCKRTWSQSTCGGMEEDSRVTDI